ncbi:MAG: fumarylacetoacetate hydrolase family protein [Bacteroidia bacterium]
MKILCIGRNYAKHAEELNNPIPDDPIIFTKPPGPARSRRTFVYPDFSDDVHFECELVCALGKKVKTYPKRKPQANVEALGLGIDFTARDLQQAAKEKGLPWALAPRVLTNPGTGIGIFAGRPLPRSLPMRYTCHVNGSAPGWPYGHDALSLYYTYCLPEQVYYPGTR